MNWMLIPSLAFVICGLLIFARPQWGPSTRWLTRKLRGAHIPSTLADEAVMRDLVGATALIIIGSMGLFGLLGPLDLLQAF